MPTRYEVALILEAENRATAALNQFEGQLEGIGKRVKGAAEAAQTLLPVAAGAFAGLGVAIGASVKSAADFEKTMSGVKAVMSPEEVTQFSGALQDLALRLGKDTVFSAREAAQGMEELVKGGVSVENILSGAADATLNLAAAGGTTLPVAAEIAANALAQFNLKGEQMEDVANKIAGAANASSIDVNDFKFSLSAAGAVASTVGFNFGDLSTAIAVMGEAGIKGSDAGTSLKTMMLNLQPTTKAQIAEFRRLGITGLDSAQATAMLTERIAGNEAAQKKWAKEVAAGTGTLQNLYKIAQDLDPTLEGKELDAWAASVGILGNRFFDASGKVKSMAEVAGVLQEATEGMTDAQRLASLEILFGSDAIRAGAVLTKAGAAGFNEMAAAMGKVSAEKVAEQRLNNLNGSLEQLRGSIETAQITLTQRFLPALRGIVDGVTALINKFLELDPKWQTAIATAVLVATAVAGVTTAFLALIAVLPALIAGFTAAGTIFTVVAGILTGPVALAIGAIILAAVALKLAWETNFYGIRDTTEAVWKFLSENVFPFLMAVLTALKDVVLPQLAETWATRWAEMSKGAAEAWAFLSENVFIPLGKAFAFLKDELLPAVGKDWDKTWGELKSTAETVWNFLRDNIFPPLNAAINFIKNTTLPDFSKTWDFTWTDIQKKLGEVWEEIKKATSEALTRLKEWLDGFARDAWNAALEIGKSLIEGLLKAINDMAGQVKDAMVNVVREAVKAAQDFANNNPITTVIRNVVQSVGGAAAAAGGAAQSAAQGGIDWAAENFKANQEKAHQDNVRAGRGAGGEIIGGDFAQASGQKAAAAIAQAMSLLGRGQDYIGWCAKFVANMFGKASAGGNANQVRDRYMTNRGDPNPPAGGIVYFREHATNAGYGHIGISLGNGRFISATNAGVTIDSGPASAAFSVNPPSHAARDRGLAGVQPSGTAYGE